MRQAAIDLSLCSAPLNNLLILQSKHSYRFTHHSLDVFSSAKTTVLKSDIVHAKIITTEVQRKRSITSSSAILSVYKSVVIPTVSRRDEPGPKGGGATGY